MFKGREEGRVKGERAIKWSKLCLMHHKTFISFRDQPFFIKECENMIFYFHIPLSVTQCIFCLSIHIGNDQGDQ